MGSTNMECSIHLFQSYGFHEGGTNKTHYSVEPWNGSFQLSLLFSCWTGGILVCIFFLTNFFGLIDTMSIILRRKTLTPFQFFHHISLFMYAWYLYTERQGIVWLSFLNSLTKSVFYGVPLLTSLRPSATRTARFFMIFVSLLEVGFQQILKLFVIFVFIRWEKVTFYSATVETKHMKVHLFLNNQFLV